jgi:hypothetical protein
MNIRTSGTNCIISNPPMPPSADSVDMLRIDAIKKPFTNLSFVNLISVHIHPNKNYGTFPVGI